MEKVEVWGGVECTIRRVGNGYTDQLVSSGHRTRLEDLDAFAELGIRKLRYPILWEQVAPESLDNPDWTWADERMARLRELGIDPIITLLHHGSGPRYTALNKKNFVPLLARFARMVAERYPWIKHYTPVNEPLTTARFSGLYGIWYPHALDDKTFVRIQLNHIKGTRAAMQAIREVTPDALLVQTEDLGKTHCTPKLVDQAEFENNRRWLTYDLLCGKLDQQHPLWNYLRQHGASERELLDLVKKPCPPDILGINHYVTSERFLDENHHYFPAHHLCQSEARVDYADVEAVRVRLVQTAGLHDLLLEAWNRYRIPVAVTEVHLDCTREEQMRWVQYAWDAANQLKEEGVDMRAITIWSLLGAYDWNTLLTQEGAFYESGVFDMRGGKPRPTALFKMVKGLATEGHYNHPLLQGKGWWERDDRFLYHHLSPTSQSTT
ncbi:family 1 glycosylhydrolase [Hymenobacter chitinivorans]|uniref:dTDP-4-dehydrorhamnose reductase n=1 Tax=Hymenobacter chitinivorans DSM 11115 TaxID=1121954 RepID=A0A2M9B9V8_9BACT|nr:family 1 glycosylhydrolase [Hymenobacter chitinivorans]PJJ54715.1 dTDP-4-dehydrorhamnose reductase [Hymenobacter chitinivorans DSM 11115]